MYKHFATIILVSVAFSWDASNAAQEEEPVVDGDTRRCLNIRRIRRTRIVDDRNMLFYASGSVVYHNILRQPCNGLAREGRYGYETSAGSLCTSDIIYVLYDDAFGGLRRGNACSLGTFHEITAEDAKALLESDNEKIEPAPLPMPEPEDVGSDEDEAEEQDVPER